MYFKIFIKVKHNVSFLYMDDFKVYILQRNTFKFVPNILNTKRKMNLRMIYILGIVKQRPRQEM